MKTLDQWLDSLNQNKIDFGLERIKQVLARPPFNTHRAKIITVGGTNGKGSAVAAVSRLLQAAGFTVGEFTSPHIFRFNERIKINGIAAADQSIVSAFDQIDKIRGDVALSYFEYALLAAVLVFIHEKADFWVLEVGLGGRLDAVNALDSDVSLITTVDIDHSHWLGDTIEAIAAEKAAIMRSGCTLVYGDNRCPKAIKDRARQEQVTLRQWGQDFSLTCDGDSCSYQSPAGDFAGLAKARLSPAFQKRNFASALTVVLTLVPDLTSQQVNTALQQWHLPGRIQTIQTQPEVIVDVAHNRQSVQALSDDLAEHPVSGHTRAVFSVLNDKQVETWLSSISQHIDHWFIFALNNPRAMDVHELTIHLANAEAMLSLCHSGEEAYQHAISLSKPEDRVIVFGSFHVLDEVFRAQHKQIVP